MNKRRINKRVFPLWFYWVIKAARVVAEATGGVKK